MVAARVAAGGPGALAGIRTGDVLLALGGEEVLDARRGRGVPALRPPSGALTYSLLRADEQRALEVGVRPLSQGRVSLFYYLSLVGFFSLLVGTIVMLRRPPDRVALHFYAICLLFFLMYSPSYTGKLNLADWTLFWADHLAILLLPVVFLHFCLSFPERRLPTSRGWIDPRGVPARAGARGRRGGEPGAVPDHRRAATCSGRSRPPSTAGSRCTSARSSPLSFAILLDSYGKTPHASPRASR